MPPDDPLDFPTVAALVRLRLALEDAAVRARDLSDPGLHSSVVALDGAVEYALWLAARSLGIEPKGGDRAGRHDLTSAVRSALNDAGRGGPRWQPVGAQQVTQLNRMRNDAQHAGLLPEPGQIPTWVDSATAFVHSLTLAAFATPLRDISLASAIADEQLATLIARADASLRGGDTAEAFDLACRSFDEAAGRWRTQRPVQFGPVAQPRVFVDRVGAVGEQVAELDALLEVQPFALDMGEHAWLRASREQARHGWPPEADDARRAILFACSWIVRWERFDRSFHADRWAAFWDSIEPPMHGEEGRPRVLWIEPQFTSSQPGYPRKYVLLVQLANIPDRGRGGWGADIHQALADAAATSSEQVRFDAVQLSAAGRLMLSLDPGASAAAVAGLIEHAVEIADQRWRHRRDEQQQRERRRLEAEQRWRATLRDIGAIGGTVTDVSLSQRVEPTGERVYVTLHLRASAATAERALYVDALRDVGGVLTGAMLGNGDITFEAFELTTENRERLAAAVQRAEDAVAYMRDQETAQIAAFEEFAGEIRRRLGQPPA